MPVTGFICLARRLYSACIIFKEVEGHGEVSVFTWAGPFNERSHSKQRKSRELYLLFPLQMKEWASSGSVDGTDFWRGAWRGEVGGCFWVNWSAILPFWSLTDRRALAVGRQPCSGAWVVVTSLCTQQSKSHSHVCANSPAKERGLLSPVQSTTRRESSL